ncbi:triphosphate tunel metalloenzyme 3 [Selaginella moellendorffii]|uniref:triphosphate tunel metalloenzyme 3 n=1 Tax=Selaginella moellendorffii TaxID=88036 RepID=UPI000D1C6D7B|nr:triphosphate tunel metalloenzyme 3 [Selaginella moellendorffii]|eukprot:XP_002980711.2 triphosphate tunel metalloenzyme 3 [Selaginella moellendorffii]
MASALARISQLPQSPGFPSSRGMKKSLLHANALARSPRIRSAAMEVEVKLTLPDDRSHARLAEILLPYFKIKHEQENLFFDGANAELSARRAVLRLRFYNGDARCVVSLKARAILENGVSRVEESEEDLDAATGRECVGDPSKLPAVTSAIVQRVVREFGVTEFVCLGGFKNTRQVFEWEGEKLELDETRYAFGTAYEVECETPDPERVRAMLEEFLGVHGIPFSHSVASKFAVFRSGRLPSDEMME